MELNNNQLSAITHFSSPLLVLAGAGSGKTRVITQKIIYLIEKLNISPDNVYAVTFTNKAAREMLHRTLDGIKDKNTKAKPNIFTFHSFGIEILKKHGHLLDYKNNFSIFDQSDALEVIKQICVNEDSNLEYLKNLQNTISKFKNNLMSPKEAIDISKNEIEFIAAKIYHSYQECLHSYNALDFDDLIYIPFQLISRFEEVKHYWTNKIEYLLVDEYQDTNFSQYQLMRMLVKNNFTVVGDDYQSVYSWRGARPENIKELQTDFPNLKVIFLEQNYRSTNNILKAANQIIKNNNILYEKNLWSANGNGDLVRIHCAADENAEMQFVVQDMNLRRLTSGCKHKDFAILFRGNQQGYALEKVLRENNIPYKITGSNSFFGKQEVKDILAYLKLLVNPDDDNAFLRVANVPKRELGPSTLTKLATYSKNRGKSLFECSFDIGLSSVLSDRQLKTLQDFVNFLNLTAFNAEKGDTIGVIRNFVDEIGYKEYLFNSLSNAKQAEKKWATVEELLNWVGSMLTDKESSNDKTLKSVLQKIMLIDLLSKDNEDQEKNEVHLLTIHSAKGLEFNEVYIIGVEEDILPHKNSSLEEEVEEERRIMYVAVTRARKKLTLSYCQKRTKYGDIISCDPSRFLSEIPRDVIVNTGVNVKNTREEIKEISKNHMDAIWKILEQSNAKK